MPKKYNQLEIKRTILSVRHDQRLANRMARSMQDRADKYWRELLRLQEKESRLKERLRLCKSKQ